MCGRTVCSLSKSRLARVSGVSHISRSVQNYDRSYNLSPSSDIPAVLIDSDTGNRELICMKWGLEPPFKTSHHLNTINARVEHVSESKLYGRLLDSKRCVVVVDGFYEWSHINKECVPYLIRFDDATPEEPILSAFPTTQSTQSSTQPSHATNNRESSDTDCILPEGVSPLFLAGLYDVSTDSGSYSCTILTTDSCGKVGNIHDRMPVLLSPSTARDWLGCDSKFSTIIPSVLDSSKKLANRLICIQVSPLVNSIANKSKEVTLPIAEHKKRSLEKGLGRFFSTKKPKLL